MSFTELFIEPWTQSPFGYGWDGWVILMGFLVSFACGLVGIFLVLRQVALVGDAISHSLLPGLVGAFLITGSRSTSVMFIGAALMGLLTVLLIEFLHRQSRIKPDAAIAVVFSTLFAIGVILVTLFADHVDLDTDCVLYGELGLVAFEQPVTLAGTEIGPLSVVRMAGVAVGLLLLVSTFYKELMVSSFDPGLSRAMGMPTGAIHYGLMAVLSIVIVSAFEAVGAILVIAMLIFPGATALLLTDRLPRAIGWVTVLAVVYSILGFPLALSVNASPAASLTTVALGVFVVVWFISPRKGLIMNALSRQRGQRKTVADAPRPVVTEKT